MLKIWDWMTGALKHEVPVLSAVEPYIAVRASRNRRWFEADTGEGGQTEKMGGRAKRGKRGKGKNKQDLGKEVQDPEVEVVREEDAAARPTSADVTREDTPADAAETSNAQNEGEKVLVIRRVESLESEDGTYIVFSAVG